MVQLVVKEQGGTDLHFLDISDVSIKGNYSAKEIQDLSSQKSDFTQAFTLPFSKINNEFFSYFFDVVSVDGSFNSSIKCEADIYVDSNIVFSGFLQLLNVNNATQYYEALVFGVVSNIANSLNEKRLNQLDLSEFTHVLTQANLKDSWTGDMTYTTSVGQVGDEILYPIIDYGYGYTNGSLTGSTASLFTSRLKPTIKVKVLFEKILQSIGYTVSSNFFNTDFFSKQYMTIARNTQTITSSFQDTFRVGLQNNQVISPSTSTVLFSDETSTNPTGDFYDGFGNYDAANATPHYNVPFTGQYAFTITMGYAFSANVTTSARLYIKKLNIPSFSQEVTGAYNQLQDNNAIFDTLGTSDKTFQVNTNMLGLDANDEIYFQVVLGGAGQTLTIYKDQTNLNLYVAPVTEEGSTVDFSADNTNMGTEKQVDFISAITSRYNLIIELDKQIPNQLNIEPAQDYFDAGTSKDWSNKLDLNKPRTLKPTNEFRNKDVEFADLEDVDRSNAYHQNTFFEAYNSYKSDFEGDFGEGTLKLKTIFSSFLATRVQGHDMMIAKLYRFENGNLSFTELKPKLFMYSGLKTCQPYRFFSQASGTFEELTSYPFCNTYLMSGDLVVDSDKDIRFKTSWAYDGQYFIQSQTTTDTLALCWRKYLNNIYNREARVLSAQFYLTPEDIAQFKYNDKIFVQNSYYRINKIMSYALGKNLSTKVELIKIIESNLNDNTLSSFGCDLTYLTSNLNGSTNWVDSDGVAAQPTQLCCEANNLSYINNECYWNIPDTPDEETPAPIQWSPNVSVGTTGGDAIVSPDAVNLRVYDETNIYLEGTVRRIGKNASDTDILSWDDATNATKWIANTGGASVAGANKEVQFNDNGAFGAEAGFEYDKTTDFLSADNIEGRHYGENTGFRTQTVGSAFKYMLAPSDFSVSAHLSTTIYTRNNGGSVQPSSNAGRENSIFAMVFLPIGYRITGFRVSTNVTRSVSLTKGDISNTTITNIFTGTSNTGNSLTTAETIAVNKYYLLKVEVSATTDAIYGGEISLEKI